MYAPNQRPETDHSINSYEGRSARKHLNQRIKYMREHWQWYRTKTNYVLPVVQTATPIQVPAIKKSFSLWAWIKSFLLSFKEIFYAKRS